MNWLLAVAVGTGLAWIALGYIQWDVHHGGRALTGRQSVALHVAEFTSALTCLMAVGQMILNVAMVNV